MANSVKLLNYVDPDGDFIKFYTELNSDFQIGDKVFIVGGNYDNTKLAESDPYNEYAAGYTVIASDLTNVSNSITLNIKYNDSRFSANPTSTLFEPFNVYINRIETFKNINSIAEAFISKNRFKSGEFNGGRFTDGIFGEYKKYDDSVSTQYLNDLITSNIDQTNLEDVQNFFYSYNIQETPIPNNEFNAYYNRKQENDPAVFSNGVFLGGNWQWGVWNTKYPSNQSGKYQQLNALSGVKNPLDESKYNITEFSNNFNNLGYNIAASGNFGRIWYGQLMIAFDDVNNRINLNFIPFELRRALSNAFNVKLDIRVLETSIQYRNNKNFTIDFDPTPNSSDFTLLNSGVLKIYEKIYPDPNFGTDAYRIANVQIEIADPSQVLLSDPMMRKLSQIAPTRSFKNNSILTGRVQDADFFNGLWLNGQFQGGEWWNGEFTNGRIGSILNRTTWHDGNFNGTSNFSFANDLFWLNGQWQNGSWEGARNFRVSSLIKLSMISGVRNTDVQLDIAYENMFQIGETILLSYFKNSNSSQYLTNWTNDFKTNLLEFQNFTILNIVHDYTNRRVLLTIDLNLDDISNIAYTTNIYGETIVDINYQYARVSNSYFANGVWKNGNWQNGYFNGNLKPLSIESFSQTTLTIKIDDVSGLKTGQMLQLSNIRIIYVFNYITVLGGTLGTAAGGVQVDDRANQQYWLNIEQSLPILDIDIFNNTVVLDMSKVVENIIETTTIIDVGDYFPNQFDKRIGLVGYSTQVWEYGIFNTGVWENAIWKNGQFKNVFIEDPTNVQNKSIWRSGVWLNGNWDNGVWLSGIWESGVWLNGVMTNGWKRSTTFWNGSESWMQGDSIWYDGEWLNGQLLRGVWKKGIFENGTIENAGIDEIEITNGKYLNGKLDSSNNPIFSNELNTTNALNSAPALIFVDQHGWVQLDQSSWYQIDYNVIFKDLYMRSNPFNDQMFNIIDRNTTASKIKVTTQGGSGTHGTDIPQSFIDNNLPIVALRNIVDIVETDINVFWIADQGYKRIIEVNNTGTFKQLKVIGRIINDENDNVNLVYGNILKIASDNALDGNNLTLTRWVYVLQTDKIVRINKDDNSVQTMVTFATLQSDQRINIQEWIDIFVYPNRLGIPETLFIMARVKQLVNTSFVDQFVIIAFNTVNSTYQICNFSGSIPSDSVDMQEWLTGLTSNNLSLSTLKIKGFSLGDALELFYKLPVNIAGTNHSYSTNDIQRQKLSFVNNAWTISEYSVNFLTAELLNNLIVNSSTYIFTDFAVRILSPSYRVFLLDSNSNIYYTQGNGLVPLVTSVNVNSIDFGIQEILGIRSEFGVNMSPVIIPQVTRRFGAIDQNSLIDVLEPVSSVPTQNELIRWYIDQPSKRLLKLSESKAPFLYDIADEYGIDSAQMQTITYITNTENSNRLLMIEQLSNQVKQVIVFNKISASFDRTFLPYYQFNIIDNNFYGLAIGSTIIDVYYETFFLFVLYKFGSNFYYDYYRVDKQSGNTSFNNVVTINNPTLIAYADEYAFGDITGSNNKIVYVGNDTTIVNNFNVIIFSSKPGETIVDFAFTVLSNKRYMFVATVDGSNIYRIYLVTKKYVSYQTTPLWPGDNSGNNSNPSSYDLLYQSTTRVEKLYNNIGILQRMVANLDGAVDLLNLEYDSKSVKNVNSLIYTSDSDFWIADNKTNRLIEFQDFGTSGNILHDFGQYQQPFEIGTYLRNVKSLRYLTWNASKYLIFIDQDINNVNRKVRAINVVSNNMSSAETVVIQDLIDGDNQITSIQDLFGDYLYPYVFVPSGTSGTAGTYVPPGLTNDQDIEFVDIWTKNESNIGVLKILYKDNNTDLYYILTLNHTSQGFTTHGTSFVASGTSGYSFDKMAADSSNIYLSDNNKVYHYNASVSLVNILPAPIQDFYISEGTAGSSIFTVTNNGTMTKLYRIDGDGITFTNPISDNNSQLFNAIDFSAANYDLNKIIVKTENVANKIVTTNVSNVVSNIEKIAKFNNVIFAHSNNVLYKIKSNTINYVTSNISSVHLGIPLKIIAFSENLAYVLYNDATIVEFDFSLSLSVVLSNTPAYSDSNYQYKAIDITNIPNRLIILYRIISNTLTGDSVLNSFTDVWSYDITPSTSGYAKLNYQYTTDTTTFLLDGVTFAAGTNSIAASGTAGFGNNSTVTSYVGTLGNTSISPTSVFFNFKADVNVPIEIFGTGNGSPGSYTGNLANTFIIPNTLTITAGTNGNLTDDGNGNLIGVGTGTIDYTTGAYDFLMDGPVFLGEDLTATYDYLADQIVFDDGSGILIGNGSGVVDYVTGNYTFTTSFPIPFDQGISYTYTYLVIVYVTQGKPYSVLGELISSDQNNKIWVYVKENNNVLIESLGVGNGTTGPYAGTLVNTFIVPNTLSIAAGTNGFLTDDGVGNLIGAGIGTIDYTTGAFDFTTTNSVANGLNLIASYYHTTDGRVWLVNNGDVTTTVAPNAVEFIMIDSTDWLVYDTSNVTNLTINNVLTTNVETNYATFTLDNFGEFFKLNNYNYYGIITNLDTNLEFVLIPQQIFNWYLVTTTTVPSGTEIYVQNNYPLTSIQPYHTQFNGESFVNSYSAFDDLALTSNSTNTLISPNVSGRVLYNTIWRNGQFNVGSNNQNSAYTAYLVSSRWLSGRFRGSWDTPRYFDNYALRQESLFIGGIFGDTVTGDTNSSKTAIWNDGLFLGGDWKNGQFLNGHFFSENQILVENIAFPNIVINQIKEAKWDYEKQMLRVEVDHFKWDPTVMSYVSTASQLAKYNLIQIPTLFQKLRLNILEIRKNKYPISGFNEINLICEKPTIDYPTGWLVDSYVYISGLTSYIEYLYGEHYVTDTFTYQNNLWITIRSDFNQFNSNGSVVFGLKKPYVGFDLLRIQEIAFNDTLTSSVFWTNLPVSSDTLINQVNFFKELLNYNVDVINDTFLTAGTNGTAAFDTVLPNDFGTVIFDDTLQAYSRSANGVNNTITLNNVSSLNTILLNNVSGVNYTGGVDIYDITVINSNVNSTNSSDNSTSVQYKILNSLFLSGSTNIPLKDSGWLNKDDRGFPYANSTLNAIAFIGDWSEIIDIDIDPTDNSVFILYLTQPLKDLNVNQYIWLRGFSGNKSNVIGSAYSKGFRVIKIHQNVVYIKNPFKYYNAENIIFDKAYRTKFDSNELLEYKQTLNLRKDLQFIFKYAYASTNVWNGGTFIGQKNTASNFYGIWNSGNFSPLNTNSNFNGEWFSTPYNYYWAGNINVLSTQVNNSFSLELDLNVAGIDWPDGDLVRVDFINNTPSGFYATISNSRVSNTYSTFFNSGTYTVNIVRLTTNNYLINDRNLAIGPETSQQYHLIYNQNIFDWSNSNNAMLFDGLTKFNISYINEIVDVDNNAWSFDFWFNSNSTTSLTGDPLLSFRMTGADLTIFVNFDGFNYNLIVQYSLNSITYVQVVKQIDTNWHHVYVTCDSDQFFIYYDVTDQITILKTGGISNQVGLWNIVNSNYNLGLFIDRNTLREINIGIYRHVDTVPQYAQAGAIDQLRFWNIVLPTSIVDNVYNAKILSKDFAEIGAQITFDDPGAEYLNIRDSKLRISNVEYVDNIAVRNTETDLLIYLNFEIEEIETWTPVIKFSTNQIQNLSLEKPYVIIASNNNVDIDFSLQQDKFSDTPLFSYSGVINSFPRITDYVNQFFYSTTSLDKIILTYDSETNNGTGSFVEHGFVLSSINSSSWNILPRIAIRFKNDGLNATISVMTSLNSSPLVVASSTTLSLASINPFFSKYSVYIEQNRSNLDIKVILGPNQYANPIWTTSVSNPFSGTVYIGNAYGSYLTKFQNRRVESFKHLSNSAYGQVNEVYITNDKWIFNPSTPFATVTSLQNSTNINLNLPKFCHFGDETVLNIASQTLIKYNDIIVYSNDNNINNQFTLLNDLINGDDTNINVKLYLNQDNYLNYSNYFIIYPAVTDYGILKQTNNGTAGTAGLSYYVSGIGTPSSVTLFKYYKGDSLDRLILTDQFGTNLDIYPSGGPITIPDYFISETFALQNDNTPRWTQDNVTFTSTFNNGNFISKVWRSGTLNNGTINVSNFIWKWGIATGGTINDTGGA